MNISETQQAVPLMRKSLSGPPVCALSGEICLSARYWETTETQGVWESPASYSDPVQYENEVWSGSGKRFFGIQSAKLCFVTSTGCYFWQNIIVFKSRETQAPQTASELPRTLGNLFVTCSHLSYLKALVCSIHEAPWYRSTESIRSFHGHAENHQKSTPNIVSKKSLE